VAGDPFLSPGRNALGGGCFPLPGLAAIRPGMKWSAAMMLAAGNEVDGRLIQVTSVWGRLNLGIFGYS
jgi:hypothetical protein